MPFVTSERTPIITIDKATVLESPELWVTSSPSARARRIQAVHDELEAGEWYKVKGVLNWWERDQLDRQLEIKRVSIKDDKADAVELEADNTVIRKLKLIKAYLVEWSHDVKITEESIKQLTPLTASFLAEAIFVIHDLRWGVPENGPLPTTSEQSSAE